MLMLVVSAVRARTAQVLTILLLAAVASAVAVAGPWYGFAAAGRAAEADLSASRAVERIVSVRTGADTQGLAEEALTRFAGDVRRQLPPEFGDPITGLTVSLSAKIAAAPVGMSVAYRDEFCANVRLEGPCPSRAGEVAISHEAAQRLGVRTGDQISLTSSVTNKPLPLRVVALYALADISGPYWAGEIFRTQTQIDPAFTVLETFATRQLWNTTMVYDAVLPVSLIRGDGGYDLAGALAAADTRITLTRFRLQTNAKPLLEMVARDRATILRGVRSAGLQTLVLTWFAIGLAGWYTLRDRRADTALLKLRGAGRFRILRLAWGQHLVPLLIGAAIGIPAGYLLARWLAGDVEVAPDRQAALTQSAITVAAVLLGSLAVLAAVEAVMLSRPVTALLSRTAPARGDWRSALADLLLIVIAGAALYQARSGGPADGLAVVAPALIALALGLLLARLLRRVAGRSSAAELGASRVLTVEAPNRTALLHAVRTADPEGRAAMAVVRNRNDDNLEILEVDSDRLAAVALWRPEYGPVTALREAVGTSARPAPPVITGDRLSAGVRRDGTAPVQLTLHLQDEVTGVPVTVGFGTLRAGEQTVTAPVDGCATAAGCRIVRWEVTTPPDRTGRTKPPPKGSAVTLRTLSGLDAGILGDIARWRPGTNGANLNLAADGGGLRMTPDENATELKLIGTSAYAADTPMPLPVVLAGAAPDGWRYDDRMLESYGPAAPVRIAGAPPGLPMLGRSGALTDLDAVRRLAADADAGGEFQVWLTASAPPGLIPALTAAGVSIAGDQTVTGRAAWLGAQGPAAVVRFALLSGFAALLLAATVVAVAATVDNRSLGVQLRALRTQGLPVRTAVSTGYAGTAAVLLAGLATGALAAVLAVRYAGSSLPPFADGWQVLPPPEPLTSAALVVAAVLALLVLGLSGLFAVLPLVRTLRKR